jgi:hypothetical protein
LGRLSLKPAAAEDLQCEQQLIIMGQRAEDPETCRSVQPESEALCGVGLQFSVGDRGNVEEIAQ